MNIVPNFRYIDQGKNPQLYTKDCMEKSLANNEAVKGKIDAFKVLLTRLFYMYVVRDCVYVPL